MAAPTVTEIRNFLEGYGITAAVVSDSWIELRRDNLVIPHVEDITGMTFDGESTVTEYYNGTGENTLILNRQPVNSVTEIIEIGTLNEGDLAGSVELIGDEGMLRVKTNYPEGVYYPIFQRGSKNLKITYTYGTSDYPGQVHEAIIHLVAAFILVFIGSRTGGGSLGVQAFSRNYGKFGKYSDILQIIVPAGYALLRKYMNEVVGS